MNKATLKHASGQYVLIVDESPMNGQFYYDKIIKAIGKADNIKYNYNGYPNLWRIIAAENLDGVKGIRFRVNKAIIFHNDGNYKMLVNKLIDTEVEVTEEEDYWVIKL